ncbi:MAG: Pilin [candidate division CPR2 bacterium GW2011_GWC1_39_9]|uniref:Pilin n=1 Tax=candidate division CPR2 bacterium GW2011_GWC2_39_10 TaxID=1618345 RepID=A0A0G0PZR2_UNCC2|nr:MAG: Pilin [candidate division CPR2 bacterium GW2011_GWC2_39_10]KKR36022.1 MAG: Pilin [candidate division CPR2 bacterium GW2011_GWC1_39_9]
MKGKKSLCLQSKGLTLIELIIVVGIIGILSGIAVIRWGNIKKDTDLELAAELVQSEIVKARENSLAPKPSTALSAATDVNGYGFMIEGLDSLPGYKRWYYSHFVDKVGTVLPANQDRFSSPDDTQTKYSFRDQGSPADYTVHKNIHNINFGCIYRCRPSDADDSTCLLVNSGTSFKGIVFKVAELPSERKIYYTDDNISIIPVDGTIYKKIIFVLQDTSQNKFKKININMQTGEVWTSPTETVGCS